MDVLQCPPLEALACALKLIEGKPLRLLSILANRLYVEQQQQGVYMLVVIRIVIGELACVAPKVYAFLD